jgi:hypothetical protein
VTTALETQTGLAPFPTATFLDALRAADAAQAAERATSTNAPIEGTLPERTPTRRAATNPTATNPTATSSGTLPDVVSDPSRDQRSEVSGIHALLQLAADSDFAPSGFMNGPGLNSAVAFDAREAEALTPAGWYPDPAGRFDIRYWDGQTWTERVMTEEQPTVDIARADRTDKLWIDSVVDLGLLRKCRVVVTNQLIRFDDKTVMLNDVTAISWSGMSGRGFVDARLSCTLWTTSGKFRLEYATARFERAQLARLRRAFQAIGASIAQNVEPRLVAQRLEGLANGEALHVGSVTLRASGITVSRLGRKKHFGWGDVAVTERRDGAAVIGFGTNEVSLTLEVPTILRDASILPELIRACVTRFA